MRPSRCAACGRPIEKGEAWRASFEEPDGEAVKGRSVSWSATLCPECGEAVEQAARDEVEEIAAWS